MLSPTCGVNVPPCVLETYQDEDKRQVLLVGTSTSWRTRAEHHLEAKTAMREHIDNQEITVSRNIKREKEQEKPVRGRKMMEGKILRSAILENPL